MKTKLFRRLSVAFDDRTVSLRLWRAELCPKIDNVLSDLFDRREAPCVFLIDTGEFLVERVSIRRGEIECGRN